MTSTVAEVALLRREGLGRITWFFRRMLQGGRALVRLSGSKASALCLADRWEELPSHLRTDQQLAGTAAISCGATHGVMEKCNFACTSCYLSDVANYTRPLPFHQVKEQLDVLRAYLGDQGKCQITSGEVTLLDKHELGKIIAYAISLGLDPMVMTNGQRLLQVPDYLTTLMANYGLEKICFHIDTTQNGRPGLKPEMTEADLNPVRDRYADLVAHARQRTGKRLHVANTVTVTEGNIDGIGDIVRWVLDNTDTVRLLSFLPVAEVGRTTDSRDDRLTMAGVWEKICAAMGRPLNRQAMHFGHPECNIIAPLLVVTAGRGHHLIEVVREDRPWDSRIMSKGLRHFSHHVDLNREIWWNCMNLVSPLLRRPGDLLELVAYSAYRAWSARTAAGAFLWNLMRGRRVAIRPLMLVVHKFMDAQELETPLGQERVAACVFKVPVNGSMVSMCQVNTGMRLELNLESITEEKRDLVAHILAREPDPMPAVDLPDPEVLEGASTATIAAQRPEQRAADRAPIEGRPK